MPPPAEGIASRFILGPTLRTQPDRRLVTLVREGYESAFEEIVRRYGKPLTRYAAAIVGGRSEDVTQDAFSKALAALRRGDEEIELRPWLFRIVRNTALNDLRDSPPSPEVLAEAIAGGSNPAEELERREELTELIKRLQALPEPQRAAIVMRELEGLSHEEIAAALGLTGGGARQAIYRARQALRDGLGMLIPLPLLQAMLSGTGPSAAEAAVGAAGVGSAGVALKATAATVLVAGAVGAGVALNNPHKGDDSAAPIRLEQSSPSESVSTPVPATSGAGGGDDSRGESEPGDDHGGRGQEAGDDRGGHGSGGHESESGDDHGDRGDAPGDDHAGDGAGPGEERGGHGGPSGHGGNSGPGDDARSGTSGRGGGPGSGGGGRTASGHGGPEQGDGSDAEGHGVSGSGHGSGKGSSGGGGGSGPSQDGGGAPVPSGDLPSDDDSGSGSSGSGGSGSDPPGEETETTDDGGGGPG